MDIDPIIQAIRKKIKYPRIQQNILTHNCIKMEYSSKPKYLVKAFMS